MSKELRVGNIFTFTGCNVKYICTNYVDLNKGDVGACCYNETYHYMELDKFINLVKDNTLMEKKVLLEHSNTMRRLGFNVLNVRICEDEAPYELKPFEAVKIRRKKAKTVTVYE